MPSDSYTRPLQSLGALPPRNRENQNSTRPAGETCTATYTWQDYMAYKNRMVATTSDSNRHPHKNKNKSWQDHHHLVHERASAQLGFVMTIFVVEDLWDDIVYQAREVLVCTWEDEFEALRTELMLRREINAHRGRTGTAEMMSWLEEGLELIGDPKFGFDPEYLRQNYPYDVGETVGDLKACVVRCLLREQYRKLNVHFKRRPRTVNSVEGKRLRGLRVF